MLLLWCVALLLGQTLSLTDEEIAAFIPSDPDFVERNTGLRSQVWATDNGDGSVTVNTNGIPSHDTWQFPNNESGNPHSLEENWSSYKMFKDPIMRSEGDELMCIPNGAIGIATSGVYIYSWWAAEKGCPYARDFEELDICEGHPASNGEYHYHHYSPCVQMPTCGVESPLYGVALDGIPIYGPFADNGQQLTRIDLDKCGGRYDSNGRYKYHVTIDPPFFPSCFKGEIRKDVGKSEETFTCGCPYDDSGMPERGPKPEDGGRGPPDDGGRGPPDGDRRGPPDGGEGRPKPEIICDFSGDVNLPAVCVDKISVNATMSRKWIQLQEYQDLAPCCPSGADCGASCKTEEGIKDVCEVETRRVGIWQNVPKNQSCWDACYDDCFAKQECNCKRKCKRQCIGRNGASDDRRKREVLKKRVAKGKCVKTNKPKV